MQLMFRILNYENIIILIVGAIIGYVTNYLAIKMIFKPHKAKYFLGIKVPFTPGVIAKERKRIAKNIGETIENKVLTKEDINEFLEKIEIDKKVDELITNYLNDNKKLTLKIFLEDKFNKNISIDLKKFVFSKLEQLILQNQFKDSLNIISESIFEYISKEHTISEIKIKSEFIFNELLNNFNKYINTEEFSQLLEDKLDNAIVNLKNNNETLDEAFTGINLETKLHIKANLNYYTEAISDYLVTSKSEKFHEELKKVIDKILKSSVNPMFLGFINLDAMYDSGIEKLIDYLKNEENRAEILFYIDGVLNKIFEQKISSVTNVLPKETIKLRLTKEIIKAINNIDVGILTLEKFNIDESYIKNLLDENKLEIKQYIYNILKNIIEDNLVEISEVIKNTLLNIELQSIISDTNFKISNIANFENYILNGASFIIDKIEISNIVENKLNDIDIDEIEKMILSVARKELQYITMLGGVLGFIIAGITIFV